MNRILSRSAFCVMIATLFSLQLSRATVAQDPVKVAPESYKVAFENDSIRVVNVTTKAGEKGATHSHPDHLVYAITGGKVKFTHPDGTSKEVELKAGESKWVKAEMHATENVGKTDIKSVVFELKKPAPASPKPKAAAPDDQLLVAPDSTKVAFENDRVRLLDVHLKAGGKQAKHSHPAYVAYAVSDAKIKATGADEKVEEKTMTAGQAMWHEATTHAVENVGTAEVHALVLEMKN